jgi:glycosyltransferase involved in cell wall biosynthesis
MDITVVIPCYNEESYIGGLLDDIAAQTVPPASIVVADCNSTDKTLEVVHNYVSELPIHTTTAPYKSAASARNAGARLASTTYILFLDADTRLPKNFIESLKTKEFDILSPRFKSNSLHPFDIFNVFILNIFVRFSVFILRKPKAIGAAMLVRKSAHDAVGGFDDEVKEFDDIIYAAKFNKGYTFGYAWKARAIFSNRRFVKEGRMSTFIQQLPDHNIFVKKVVRPVMKKTGIKKKFED